MRQHLDPDVLALHSLGEPVLDDAARRHVDVCAQCATTTRELVATVRTVRGPAHETTDVAPAAVPAHVWQNISAELGLDPSVRPASVGPSSVRPAGRGGAGSSPEVPVAQPAAPAAPPDAGPVRGTGATDLDSRRRRRPALHLLAGAAAAGLVVGAAGTALVVARPGDGPAVAGPAVLAAADLEAFGAGEGTAVQGSARLAAPEGAGSGDRVLQVRLDELPDTGDGFFEAWLIDPDTGALVSLGPVSTDDPGQVTAELVVPRGLDVAAYDVVDVSAEPLDGDPTHSGVSLARGTLSA